MEVNNSEVVQPVTIRLAKLCLKVSEGVGMTFNKEELLKQALGVSERHLAYTTINNRPVSIHADALEPFESLSDQLRVYGYQMEIVSSYRSFDRQLAIFRAKVNGERDVLDSTGKILDISEMSDKALLFAILRWSALPGLSRHHFGSDIDVFDAGQQDRTSVELVPAEVEGNGPSSAMHSALDGLIESHASFSFYRPYQNDVGGIAPERWHLSYQPVSDIYETLDFKLRLIELWRQYQLPLLSAVLDSYDEIINRFVVVDRTNRPSWFY